MMRCLSGILNAWTGSQSKGEPQIVQIKTEDLPQRHKGAKGCLWQKGLVETKSFYLPSL